MKQRCVPDLPHLVRRETSLAIRPLFDRIDGLRQLDRQISDAEGMARGRWIALLDRGDGGSHEPLEQALDRLRQCGGPDVGPADVVVIGDTPLDVACAAAAGARSIAVATGSYDVDALRSTGADVVLTDLSDEVEVLRALQIQD